MNQKERLEFILAKLKLLEDVASLLTCEEYDKIMLNNCFYAADIKIAELLLELAKEENNSDL